MNDEGPPEGAPPVLHQDDQGQLTAPGRHIPVYGSPAWHLLSIRDPRRVLAEMVHDALSWRTLRESPHVAELISDWQEWHNRRRLRSASHAVSRVAKEMGKRGYRWLSYAELENRRRLVSVEHCARCGEAIELVHPWEPWQIEALPDLSWVRCARHMGAA